MCLCNGRFLTVEPNDDSLKCRSILVFEFGTILLSEVREHPAPLRGLKVRLAVRQSLGFLFFPEMAQSAGPAKRMRFPSRSWTMKVLAPHGSFLSV